MTPDEREARHREAHERKRQMIRDGRLPAP